jgi:glucose/arabinose dehydrogenase
MFPQLTIDLWIKIFVVFPHIPPLIEYIFIIGLGMGVCWMRSYIPEGMLKKQYRWELVHTELYHQLSGMVSEPESVKVIKELNNQQQVQQSALQQLAMLFGVQLKPATKSNALDTQGNLISIVEELYEREYQLLQEYLSYGVYFLTGSGSGKYPMDFYTRELIESQTAQVNLLIQLKQVYADQGNEQGQAAFFLEAGYRLEEVVSGLTFPTDMTFDDQGAFYIAEAGFAYGTKPGEGRVIKIQSDGSVTTFAGGFKGPVTSVIWHEGSLYVAEGARGGNEGVGCGQITRLDKDGKRKVIVSGLMSCGDHFTGGMDIGPDGMLYFTVGTATNSAVVGPDNTPWLKLHPSFHDTPARDVILNGDHFVSKNPLVNEKELAITGPYKPFGTPSYDGEVIKGKLRANGVLYCCQLDGSELRVLADGFRNPFGLRFSPFNGKLYATDNGADPRGNRPIQHDWDNFWEVMMGWYGWPDFYSGLPVTLPHFHVEHGPKPTFIMKTHPILASQPIARFKNHTSSNKFDFSTNLKFGHKGQVFVAQLGDMGWGHQEERFGFRVVRVNLETGQIRDFLVNHKAEESKEGPIRPVASQFSPDGSSLFWHAGKTKTGQWDSLANHPQ